MIDTSDLLRSPLDSWHRGRDAKMAEFGGWEMPLSYAGSGVVAEHNAVRDAVGLFDVSHLGKALVRGAGAKDFVNRTLANDLNRIAPGQAQYTMALTGDGGVIDDMIAYLRSDDEVFLIPNAANTAKVVAALREAASGEFEVSDQHRDFAVFALQGPRSRAVLESLGIQAPTEYMSFVDTEFEGAPLTVCRTGYTGEHGYELVPTWDSAPVLWERLVTAVENDGGAAAGLGARDTLRTEMGYALHGHELTEDITPLEAGVRWAVGWKKDEFWGRDALLAMREAGAPRRSVGLKAVDRGVPRAGMDVVLGDGTVVGVTTSGTFSPSLQTGIALALIDAAVPEDAELFLDVRGRKLAVAAHKPPFAADHTRD